MGLAIISFFIQRKTKINKLAIAGLILGIVDFVLNLYLFYLMTRPIY